MLLLHAGVVSNSLKASAYKYPYVKEGKMEINLEFKKEDLWIGAYWRYDCAYMLWHLWVCIIPCLSIHFTIDKGKYNG